MSGVSPTSTVAGEESTGGSGDLGTASNILLESAASALQLTWISDPLDGDQFHPHDPQALLSPLPFLLSSFLLSGRYGESSEAPAAGAGRGTGVATAYLADAPGRPLPAGIPRPAG